MGLSLLEIEKHIIEHEVIKNQLRRSVIGTFTEGSVIFADASGLLGEDNANFFWDDTNNRLGIGTATPSTPLEIIKANATGCFVKSGAAGAFTRYTLGRTSEEISFAVVGGANQFFTGAIAGDAVIRADSTSSKVLLGVGNAVPPAISIENQEVGFFMTEPTLGAVEIRKSGATGLVVSSGNAGTFTAIGVGRTAIDFFLGVVGVTDQFFDGTASGDAVIRQEDSSQKLHFGVGTSGTPEMTIEDGQVGIGTASPDTKLEIFNAGTQLKLSFDATDFATFAVDTNHDLTITPSSTGQIILKPTTDSTDFFQVLDADGGTPILNVDAVNERVAVGTATPDAPFEIETTSAIGIQAITIDQNDEDKAFIDFQGTFDNTAPVTAGNLSNFQGDGVLTGPLTGVATYGWTFIGMVKIEVNGAEMWTPYYQHQAP